MSGTYWCARIAAAALAALCGGCGTYLHNPQFEQQSAAIKAGFDKIDLSAKFTEQNQRLAAFAIDEDKAVAAEGVASRDRVVQLVLGLPAWAAQSDQTSAAARTCESADPRASTEAPRAQDTGAFALHCVVSNDLKRVLGSDAVSAQQVGALRKSAAELQWGSFIATALNTGLKSAVDMFERNRDATDKRSTRCAADAARIAPVANPKTADERFQAVQHWCGEIAAQVDPTANLGAAFGGELDKLIKARTAAAVEQKQERAKAAALKTKIDAALKSAQATAPSADKLTEALKPLQDELKNAQGLVKLAGYDEINKHLDDLLAVELSAGDGAKAPAAGASPTTKRAQAAIALALGLSQLNDVYADQPAIKRVNSLLIATAGARHEMGVAKIEADYRADLIRIRDAQISARVRQAVHLWEAHEALGGHPPDERKLSNSSLAAQRTDAAGSRAIGALASWVASRDQGEIPYQVLDMKEVQLLRAKGVKEGQLGAQDYADLLKPMLAELEAYGKGGLTRDTLVQALGFIGVMSSIISTK
jgi:hypothetical protein